MDGQTKHGTKSPRLACAEFAESHGRKLVNYPGVPWQLGLVALRALRHSRAQLQAVLHRKHAADDTQPDIIIIDDSVMQLVTVLPG